VDHRNETLKKKIREAQINYVPLILTIGEKEKETGTLSVRTLDGKVKLGLSPAEFVTPVQKHIKKRILDDIVL
jgi:threonyl-tRNA synthetase